jgi:hypothetical protein
MATVGATVLAACAVTVLGAGCGGGRVIDPSLTAPARPTSFIEARFPADGVALSLPRNWSLTDERAPMVAVISSGPAIIALWRYPSGHGAITATSRLTGALAALIRAVKARDPGLSVERTGVSSVDGDGAVIIDGLEQIDGKLRRVRSEHVYVAGAELVLDTYAPVPVFPRVDHAVFSPVRRSLSLLNDGRPGPGPATTSTSRTPPPDGGTGTSSPPTAGP